MGRNILFVTTDQQRYDSIGCNGGTVARTPVIDSLAALGIRFERAYCQNTVCMPARSSMLTGQYPRTHGVIANGIPLPQSAPSVAATLREAGYRTSLIGKAHFEPIADPARKWAENRLAPEGRTGPYRGFEHVEFAGHGPWGSSHYSHWLNEMHPEQCAGFARIFNAAPSGETGAPEIAYNPIPRELYHTDWIAQRVQRWLGSIGDDEDWFCWMSFPDPHHPWDPPASERHRIDWRDLALPPGHPGSTGRARQILAAKPAHWLAWYEGRVPNVDGAPGDLVPERISDDQFREIIALIHIENELIDEAIGAVLATLEARGLAANTDVIFSTDHGELQGDFGLLYKGPYHVDSLMRLPLIWAPAPASTPDAAVVRDPVGQIDLAPTFCRIAGIEPPEYMQGRPLPTRDGSGRERALCEWDSQLDTGYRLRTIVRDGWMCTAYEASTPERGLPAQVLFKHYGLERKIEPILYDGSEGELYDLRNDPQQFENRWSEPGSRSRRDELVADLYESLPEPGPRLEIETLA